MRIIIDDKIPFIREAAAQLGEAVYLSGSAISAEDVREGLRAIGYEVEREITENDWVAMLARAK